MTDTRANIKRSISVNGHRTSVTLEQTFWDALHDIAQARGQSLGSLVGEIDRQQPENLSSAIRVFVLAYYRQAQAR